jgi:hypothetical protein
MITIRNSKLNNELMARMNSLVELDIEAKTAFRLMRIIKEVSSLVEDKIRAEKMIFDKYLVRDDQGNPVPGSDESGNEILGSYQISDADSFNREMSELMNLENSLNHEPIDFEDLKMETAKISDLVKIDFLFK